jgi:hypothetical protein
MLLPDDKPRRSGEIYADILKQGLLTIRGTEDVEYANAIADHLHNLPHLLLNLEHSGLHEFYWGAERDSFLSRVTTEQAKIFDYLWQELELARQKETNTFNR